jgi:hypothetical protein
MGLRSDQASDSTRLRLVSRGSVAGRPHVVIVGAGFGGLTAAKGLAKAAVEVTLIDRENHHLFQPLLYQVATAGLSRRRSLGQSGVWSGGNATPGCCSARSPASSASGTL